MAIPFLVFAGLLSAGNTLVVEMKSSAFLPNQIQINQGDTVKFVNKDTVDHWPASNIHPTHGIYPEFDPGQPISTGESWSFKFDKTGMWQMHDHLLPQITGTIVVKPDNSMIYKAWSRLQFFGKDSKKVINDKKFNASISIENSEIFKNDNQLYSYVKKYGPKQTMVQLNKLSKQFGDCHETAHRAGRASYEIYGAEAFKNCSAECHSGCYHGATESYFKEKGAANLKDDLNILCNSELNPFFSHQCLHGIGHGLTAWSNYDLPKALQSCELLSKGQESCFTGVFMENIIGGLAEKEGHFTWYLNSDPQYPCTIVEEKYKSSCYFLQTSRMVQLFNGDFAKVAEVCSQVSEVYRQVCFMSMGRDVGGVSRGDPERAVESCGNAPKGIYRTACLMGAAQDSFWDPSGQDEALMFCKLLSDPDEKNSCYQVIAMRNVEVMPDKNSQISFCGRMESSFKDYCLIQIK